MKQLLIFSIILFLLSCSNKITDVLFASKNNNVCKQLKEDVVLYAIFVDSKYTYPWTKYDLETTIDSIQKAIVWIENKANESNIQLDIKLEYHKTTKGALPIFQNFSRKTLSGTLYKTPLWSGVRDLYRWADKISKEAAKSLPSDTSRIITTKNSLNNTERLIARIRDIYKTDNVALIFFVNNYFTNEISLAINTNYCDKVEFGIVSFKSPSVIAHEFLHLFGAWDLYLSPFQKPKKKLEKSRKEFVTKFFPTEIMAHAYKPIEELEISPFTKYCISWQDTIPNEIKEMILGKSINPLKY